MKNTMKKLSLLIVCIVMALLSFGQKPYININGGYGFQMSSQNIPNFYNSVSYYDSSNYEQINVSLGKGVSFGGSFGYMFNEYIGVDLGINFLLGSKTEAKDNSVAGNSSFRYYSRMIRFLPTIVISPGFKKINPYAKFGVVFGVGSIYLEHDYNDNDGNVYRRYEMNGGSSFGGTASVGILVKLNERFTLYGECNMINLSYAPTKGEVTEFTQGNKDLLPDLTVKEKETEYVDNYSFNYTNPSPDSQPKEELKTKYPFGSVGIVVGIQFQFSKDTK